MDINQYAPYFFYFNNYHKELPPNLYGLRIRNIIWRLRDVVEILPWRVRYRLMKRVLDDVFSKINTQAYKKDEADLHYRRLHDLVCTCKVDMTIREAINKIWFNKYCFQSPISVQSH